MPGERTPRRPDPSGAQPPRRGQAAPARGERPARGDGPDRPHRAGAPVRGERPARTDRPERPERSDRPARPPRPEPQGLIWPEGVDDLTPERGLLGELSSLPAPTVERIVRHLGAAGLLVDADPEAALAHAVAAQDLAPRHPSVREAVGISAYLAGDYPRARSALRSWRRMTGSTSHLALLADTERALGDPGRALDVVAESQSRGLDLESRAELAIVASGARRDLGQPLAAAVALEALLKEVPDTHEAAGRVLFAWAEALREAGRPEAARDALLRAAAADEDLDELVAEALDELEGADSPS